MSEDDWEPDLESEEGPPSADESHGAGSSMGSDSSENEDWQAGSEPHWHAGTHKLWLIEEHTTEDEVRQAHSKTGASYLDRSREDSDNKRHADQELTALQIQILEEKHSDSAQAYCNPQAVRCLLERDGKDLRDFEFSFGIFWKTLSAKTQETCAHEWMKARNGCKSILHLGPRVFWKPGNGRDGKK